MVWVVELGEDDDRRVFGVCSDEDSARALAERCGRVLVDTVTLTAWKLDVETPALRTEYLLDFVP